MQKIFKKIIELFDFNKLESNVRKLMYCGMKISLIFLLLSLLLLELYIDFKSPNYLYYIGSQLFKANSIFITYFFICGISFNKLLKEKKNIN